MYRDSNFEIHALIDDFLLDEKIDAMKLNTFQ